MNAVDTSANRLARSLRETAGFVYRHSATLVVVSICWFVASLPVVTSGPATLGAYSAVRSMRNNNEVDMGAVLETLRQHGINATLVSFVPIVIGMLTMLYFYRYVVTSGVQYVILSILGVYLLVFLSFVLLSTFVRLADHDDFVSAITDSYQWTVHDPLLSVMTISVSVAILLVGVVSVVGLAIIIPAILFSFHTEIVAGNRSATDH